MPFEERLRLDDHERLTPIEEARQCDHRKPIRPCDAARLRFTLFEERELLAKEQILGDHRGASREEKSEESEQSLYLYKIQRYR